MEEQHKKNHLSLFHVRKPLSRLQNFKNYSVASFILPCVFTTWPGGPLAGWSPAHPDTPFF